MEKVYLSFAFGMKHNAFWEAKLLPPVHISVSTLLSGLIWCNQTKSRQTNVGLTSVRWSSGIWELTEQDPPLCIRLSTERRSLFQQMADLLLCGAKTFSHVQIFAPDQNKRKGTIPLCTVEVRDCGTPQHLKRKSMLILQNKTDIIRLDSCITYVLAKGWHREISKCWGVLHRISQVTDMLPFVCFFLQMDVEIYSTSQKEIIILHGN